MNFILGNVDLNIIRDVKNSVSIPVIGNGDIKTVEDAKMMFDYTGVDGIMIGRATIGNPWFIKNVIDFLNDLDTCSCTESSKEIGANFYTEVGAKFSKEISTNSGTEISAKKQMQISNEERLNVILRHLHLLIEEKGERVAVKEMRKHIAHYVKNLPNATDLRQKVNVIEDREVLEKTLGEFL